MRRTYSTVVKCLVVTLLLIISGNLLGQQDSTALRNLSRENVLVFRHGAWDNVKGAPERILRAELTGVTRFGRRPSINMLDSLYQCENLEMLVVQVSDFPRDTVDFLRFPKLRFIVADGARMSQVTMNNISESKVLQSVSVRSSVALDSVPTCLCENKALKILNLGFVSPELVIPPCLKANGVNVIVSDPNDVSRLQLKGTDAGTLAVGKFESDATKGALMIIIDDYSRLSQNQSADKLGALSLTVSNLGTGFPSAFDFTRFPELRFFKFKRGRISTESLEALFKASRHLKWMELELTEEVTELPECICELQGLKGLMLRSRHGIKLPDCMSNMNSLESLYIDDADADASVWNLKQLKRLKIGDSSMEVLPNEVANLKSLEYLEISASNLKKIEPDFANLHTLKWVRFKNAIELKELPKDLSGLTSLGRMDLLSVGLTKFPNVKGLNQLEVIRCYATKFKEIPDAVTQLPRLRVLHVVSSPLEKLPEEIGSMDSLQVLNLCSNRLLELPKSIKNIKNLKVLDVQGNRLDNRMLHLLPHYDDRKLKLAVADNVAVTDFSIIPQVSRADAAERYIPHKNWLLFARCRGGFSMGLYKVTNYTEYPRFYY